MKLSERLGNAVGVGPFSHAVSDDAPVVVTAGLLREAAELARRVEGAAVVEMPSSPGPALQGASLVIGAAAAERMGLAGQRVRLVPVEGGKGVQDES